MSFAETILSIPYNPDTEQASGLLAPMVRCMGHLLYLAACNSDEGYTLSSEEAKNELDAAKIHLTTTIATSEDAPLSTAAKAHIRSFVVAVVELQNEWHATEIEERTTHIKNLANRSAGIASYLDYELAGIRNSDPGISI